MKERPMIFSGPMIRAILEGRKTMTRRLISKEILIPDQWSYGDITSHFPCPYEVGTHLWVRETWWKRPSRSPKEMREGADTWPAVIYNADNEDFDQLREWGWSKKPSIHMPRSLSRINLEITGVKVERLQEISVDDAEREGAKRLPYRLSFREIWESIYGPDSWKANPYIRAISFKRI